MRSQIVRYTDDQLLRLYCRIWKRLDKWNGRIAWDFPTLYVLHPGLAKAMSIILEEQAYRRRVGL